MSEKVPLEKLPTGVPGLDTLLDGGISKYSFVVLTGTPGSGKTTLAHQIMFSLANPQRKALFFTIMGEPPLKMLRYQQQYAFFDLAKVGSSIKYLSLADDLQKGGFDGVLDRILNEVESFQPELIFVDSFKSVVQASKHDPQNGANLQYFVQRLGIQLSAWQATTFLIGEYADDAQEENPIFTVADGVIHLYQSMDQNAMVRKIRVVKMRGSSHMTGLHSFRIADDGLHVYPRLLSGGIARDQRVSLSEASRLTTGNAELDAMLGGGIPAGYALVVAGAPGCGKTVLATGFLKAGAALGEHGIAVSFEHALSTSHNKPLQALIDEGNVTPVYPRSLDISIEQMVTEMVEAVDRTGAKRLMIDSLSALELVLAPPFRENFQESLFRMLGELYSRGVTVLMVRTTTELAIQAMNPSTSLVDGIIYMRYAEQKGKLVKLISVPKLRGSSHSSEQRIFTTQADGLDIGPAWGGS
jgi:circadian clock protein KaiC